MYNIHINMVSFFIFFYSVLNKLTPDNFDRLVTDLANYIVGYDRETLKGAILLVRLQH